MQILIIHPYFTELVVFYFSTIMYIHAKASSIFLAIFFLYKLPDTIYMVCQMCGHVIFYPNTKDFLAVNQILVWSHVMGKTG